MNVYERGAAEYYDHDLHPTCHNLRVGSDAGFELVSDVFVTTPGPLLELGTGASTLADHSQFVDRMCIGIDRNIGMLTHSLGLLAAADALALPFREASFSGVYGSLVDPFNDPAMYSEARRVLKPGGSLIFTVPDVTWVRHNQRSNRLPAHTAGFTLQSGETVLLPSRVLACAEQEDQLRRAGFRTVRRVQVPISAIPRSRLSSRFLGSDGSPVSSDIVSVYVAEC